MGQLVVVKQFTGDPDTIPSERFKLEAEILGSLEHPQIPTLIENNTEHFSPHFVTEPVGGIQNLDEAAQAITSPVAASRVVHSTLDPIGYMHGQDVVHRDIKPTNILKPWNGKPVLNDFGIAARRSMPSTHPEHADPESREARSIEYVKYFGLQHVAATGLTAPGKAAGSFYYASAEQMTGIADIASDIYSLGLVYYGLLWGRRPYPPAETALEHQRRVVEGDIDFNVPDDRDIPSGLVTVVERATQPMPLDRYQSAEEMQEAIERAVRDSH
jgi:serine/threonine protein kinase